MLVTFEGTQPLPINLWLVRALDVAKILLHIQSIPTATTCLNRSVHAIDVREFPKFGAARPRAVDRDRVVEELRKNDTGYNANLT